MGKATVPHTNGQGEKGKTMLKALASKQRQISSDLPFDEQIENLNSLIKNPPQNSRVVEITPEVAHYILENLNIGNRSLKKARIVQYAADMMSDNWSLTNATLAFGADGYLKDGQNRLTACVRANKPFMTHAIFGIKPDSFIHMDIGAKRSHADVFTIMGVPYPAHTGSVIRYIMAFENQLSSARSIKTTNDDLRNFYNSLDHQVLELGIRLAKVTNKSSTLPVAPLAALFYIAHSNGDMEKAKSFLKDLAANHGSGVRSPVRYLLETVVRIKMDNRNKLNTEVFSVLLGRAWNNYKVGKASVKKDMTVRSDDPMPAI